VKVALTIEDRSADKVKLARFVDAKIGKDLKARLSKPNSAKKIRFLARGADLDIQMAGTKQHVALLDDLADTLPYSEPNEGLLQYPYTRTEPTVLKQDPTRTAEPGLSINAAGATAGSYPKFEKHLANVTKWITGIDLPTKVDLTVKSRTSFPEDYSGEIPRLIQETQIIAPLLCDAVLRARDLMYGGRYFDAIYHLAQLEIPFVLVEGERIQGNDWVKKSGTSRTVKNSVGETVTTDLLWKERSGYDWMGNKITAARMLENGRLGRRKRVYYKLGKSINLLLQHVCTATRRYMEHSTGKMLCGTVTLPPWSNSDQDTVEKALRNAVQADPSSEIVSVDIKTMDLSMKASFVRVIADNLVGWSEAARAMLYVFNMLPMIVKNDYHEQLGYALRFPNIEELLPNVANTSGWSPVDIINKITGISLQTYMVEALTAEDFDQYIKHNKAIKGFAFGDDMIQVGPKGTRAYIESRLPILGKDSGFEFDVDANPSYLGKVFGIARNGQITAYPEIMNLFVKVLMRERSIAFTRLLDASKDREGFFSCYGFWNRLRDYATHPLADDYWSIFIKSFKKHYGMYVEDMIPFVSIESVNLTEWDLMFLEDTSVIEYKVDPALVNPELLKGIKNSVPFGLFRGIHQMFEQSKEVAVFATTNMEETHNAA